MQRLAALDADVLPSRRISLAFWFWLNWATAEALKVHKTNREQ